MHQFPGFNHGTHSWPLKRVTLKQIIVFFFFLSLALLLSSNEQSDASVQNKLFISKSQQLRLTMGKKSNTSQHIHTLRQGHDPTRSSTRFCFNQVAKKKRNWREETWPQTRSELTREPNHPLPPPLRCAVCCAVLTVALVKALQM